MEVAALKVALAPRAGFDAPDLAPVVICERTAAGWRGLTADGEILNVQAANGVIPDSIAISRNGETVGYRAVPQHSNGGAIDRYEQHLRASALLMRANENERALGEIEAALDIARTAAARLNRSMVLLALGCWREGFDEFARCEETSLFMRPQYRAAIEAGLTPWRGQDIAGKRLLLIHDHGFGDSLMMLRYVPRLTAMGAKVGLLMPAELERLAWQCAPVTRELDQRADYVCSLLLLLQVLRQEPHDLPSPPYLSVNPILVEKWARRIGNGKRRIGVAWSVGVRHDGDYPRSAPLAEFVRALGREAELISVQQQGDAEADMLGVAHYPFEDFADCAALMSLCDEIVTVDTAAAHLAGATGHQRITLLLSHWSSWRWLAPLYGNLQVCRQDTPGDWASAFAKRA